MSDRVAEALAALEAVEKDVTKYRSGRPVACDRLAESRRVIDRAAPALLKLARDHVEHEHSVPLSWCDSCSALAELAEAVLP